MSDWAVDWRNWERVMCEFCGRKLVKSEQLTPDEWVEVVKEHIDNCAEVEAFQRIIEEETWK